MYWRTFFARFIIMRTRTPNHAAARSARCIITSVASDCDCPLRLRAVCVVEGVRMVHVGVHVWGRRRERVGWLRAAARVGVWEVGWVLA